jgi:alpha-amylase
MLSASSLSLKLALSLALIQQAAALTAAEWRDKTIYQVITDRFARPDSVTSTCNVADRL